MKKKIANISKLYIFLDGSGAQYKSRKNFYNICQFKTEYGFSCEWHFFATSHPCDGIGGSFKRLASRTSLQRPYESQITTTKDL